MGAFLPVIFITQATAPAVGTDGAYVYWLDTSMVPAVLKYFDATSWVPVAVLNYRSLVVLAADVTNNNAVANTLQDVTGLSFAVVAGVKYRFTAIIGYTAAAATTGSRWTISGPATTFLAYTSRYTLTATSQTFNSMVAYNEPAASNASSRTAGNIAVIEGIVVPSANGTVQIRFASEIANSAIVAKAGSTLEWW